MHDCPLPLARGKGSSKVFPRASRTSARLSARVSPSAIRDGVLRRKGTLASPPSRSFARSASSGGLGGLWRARRILRASRPSALRDEGCPCVGRSGLRVAIRMLESSTRPVGTGFRPRACRPWSFGPTAAARKLGGGGGRRVTLERARDSPRLAAVQQALCTSPTLEAVHAAPGRRGPEVMGDADCRKTRRRSGPPERQRFQSPARGRPRTPASSQQRNRSG